jgi:hypothetical protein
MTGDGGLSTWATSNGAFDAVDSASQIRDGIKLEVFGFSGMTDLSSQGVKIPISLVRLSLEKQFLPFLFSSF